MLRRPLRMPYVCSCVCICMAVCCVCTAGVVRLLRGLLPQLREHPGDVGLSPDQGDEIVPLKDKEELLTHAEFVSPVELLLLLSLCTAAHGAGLQLLRSSSIKLLCNAWVAHGICTGCESPTAFQSGQQILCTTNGSMQLNCRAGRPAAA